MTTNHKDEPVPIARLSGITKSYPGVKALKGVDFDVRAGEIHCLVGENGAGKSTLMRVLTGATEPDSGTIEIDGEAIALTPASAIAHGIGIVHQELDLVPAMSVAENIFLGHEPASAWGFVDLASLKKRSQNILSIFDLDISPDTEVRDLPPALQQLVQIAKALSHDNRLLILDEPTAALSDNETEQLFTVLNRLRSQGLGMVYISHRLEEVRALGDRLTVFRDGENVLTRAVEGMSQDDIIEAMVGRPLTDVFPRSDRSPSSVALRVEGLSRKGEFEDISFTLRKGEVLALAGIVGAGRSELLETIFGLRHADTGAVELGGESVSIRCPSDAIQLGMGLVPEERRETGLVLGRSIEDNISYPILDRLGSFLRIDHKKMRGIAANYIDELRIKTPSAQALAGELSGGNQQKIVIGKWLAAGVEVLLLDEPTRGVDVNAKAEIYRLIDELTQRGAAIIMASSELPEVLGVSDRVLVLAAGQQRALLDTANTTQVEIMQYAIGHNPNNEASMQGVRS